MCEQNKSHWLKLMDDFFTSERINRLRGVAGGDTYTLIYLKLQLISLKNNGVLEFEKGDFYDDLAKTLHEDTENVRFTFLYLLSCNLIVPVNESSYKMPFAQELSGSETDSAKRMRKLRKNKETPKVESIPKIFIPPTVNMVRDYCIERCNNVDAEQFVDFYQSKNWFVGKNKMKDWKASVRTWEKRHTTDIPKNNKNSDALNFFSSVVQND